METKKTKLNLLDFLSAGAIFCYDIDQSDEIGFMLYLKTQNFGNTPATKVTFKLPSGKGSVVCGLNSLSLIAQLRALKDKFPSKGWALFCVVHLTPMGEKFLCEYGNK